MTAQVISIVVLALIFVLATTRSTNMGALAFAAAFLVGTLAGGLDAKGIFAKFPGDIFVVLVGVTYLFALARANGTTDWLVSAAVRAVGGRIVLIPWVMFVITGVLTAIGAVSPAAVAIVAPIALGFAARYKINPLLMGAMVVHGAQAGGFSPISVYGSIVNGLVERNNIHGNPVALFLASLAVNTAIAVILFLVLGGRKLARQKAVPATRSRAAADTTTVDGTATDGQPTTTGAADSRAAADSTTGIATADATTSDATTSGTPSSAAATSGLVTAGAGTTSSRTSSTASTSAAGTSRAGSSAAAGTTTARDSSTAPDDLTVDEPEPAVTLTPARTATLIGLVALVVGTLVFDLDVGFTAVTLAAVLSLIWPADSRQAVAEITWPTVLLICGVLTYVAVLQAMGTIDFVGNAVTGVGIPILAALLLCYIGGIVSAFASSVGLMGALIPLAVPFLALGTVGPVGMIAAVAVSATVVDVSPFSTNGALVLANAKDVDRDAFFRTLLIYGGIIVAVAPLLIWLLFVVPNLG
ncbi:SLC13 family permease [Umezawaea tangerina]|uniref:Dicarboxylate carrier protein MatC n=1 Tax=Umezawaea tangerina TaxID=84725 RepID=A0A2T0SWZ9_9PSEU|nr:SLC13 family permease [Umezawaea tangerina]PRY37942.1 dicarboxylate carrier protein MatC [Umezawaea tangerina]